MKCLSLKQRKKRPRGSVYRPSNNIIIIIIITIESTHMKSEAQTFRPEPNLLKQTKFTITGILNAFNWNSIHHTPQHVQFNRTTISHTLNRQWQTVYSLWGLRFSGFIGPTSRAQSCRAVGRMSLYEQCIYLWHMVLTSGDSLPTQVLPFNTPHGPRYP